MISISYDTEKVNHHRLTPTPRVHEHADLPGSPVVERFSILWHYLAHKALFLVRRLHKHCKLLGLPPSPLLSFVLITFIPLHSVSDRTCRSSIMAAKKVYPCELTDQFSKFFCLLLCPLALRPSVFTCRIHHLQIATGDDSYHHISLEK